MTLISSIISDAFREGNILPLGRAPNVAQSTEALRLLNAIFSSIYGDEAGEMLQPWPLGNFGRAEADDQLPYTDRRLERPTINRRLIATNEAAMTVYLTARPQDGARMGIADPFARLADFPLVLDANGWTIEGDPTITLNTSGVFAEWFFRADLADWVRLTQKLETDEMPFPADFDNFFVTMLAMRLNPRYGRTMDEQSALIYRAEQRKFINRYLQSMPLEILDDISWPFMSRQGYDNQRDFSSTRDFDRGSYFGR